MVQISILLAVIAFIVLATTKFRLHPFLALILAAFLAAFAYGLPPAGITKTIATGFGGVLGQIGPVIVFGTIIGVILEKSGGAITMAETVIEVFGERFPTLTMSVIGYFVAIPVFCDSGFVILNALKEALAKRLDTSPVAMSVALATGLYATHTLVPPTPGPIAAAATLGVSGSLGLVIAVGACVAAVAAVAGMLWGNHFLSFAGTEKAQEEQPDWQTLKASYGELPPRGRTFAPILVPVLLLCCASVAKFPGLPFGDGVLFDLLTFLGEPLVALLIGLFLATRLLARENKRAAFGECVRYGITQAAPILLITAAGGAFGAVLQASSMGEYLGRTLSTLGAGIFLPFLVAAAFKSAQGSSTVALLTTSALIAPILTELGLDSQMGRVLAVMATGAGAMTVSHANDSFFWVVSQFSRMPVALAYRALSMATLVQGVAAMTLVYLSSLVLL